MKGTFCANVGLLTNKSRWEKKEAYSPLPELVAVLLDARGRGIMNECMPCISHRMRK